MVDRVRYTGVLSHALVSEVDLACSIYSHVLEKCIPLDGVVDIRLAFLVEVDDLCIASAFIVEYAVVIPAVLVITDEESLRICRKSGLSCS